MNDNIKNIPYVGPSFSEEEMLSRSSEFYNFCNSRRSVRTFSKETFPKEIIENIVKTAGTAPSGANKQPWNFCVVSNKELKSKIRKLVEEEEFKNYHGRMSEEWMADLEKFGTDHIKEFIDDVPYIIIVFKKVFDLGEEGDRSTNYYVNESVGLAVGFLLAAIHNAGLVSLTHTPSPMNFLEKALERPKNERAYLLIPVGFPADNSVVPDIKRKELGDIMENFD